MNPIIAANIYSKLGSSSSLLPMAVKDAVHTTGMTTSAYITGKELEAKDRIIDELGAGVIWVGGIPFFKKIADLTIFKAFGHNSKIDIRVLKDKNIAQKAIENAPKGTKIAQGIQKALDNSKTFKGLFMAKFIAATALTLGSYFALTTFRHKNTEKAIIEEIKKEELAKKEAQQKAKLETTNLIKNKQKSQNPSFGKNLSALKDFMFDPVKNMMLVDGGITAQRLGEARNPQDFVSFAIKEGLFWGSAYFIGPQIQKAIEKHFDKKGKSIDLDIKVLQDKKMFNFLKNNQIQKHVEELKKIKTDEELYDFICQNKKNLVVDMSKKSGIVKMHTQKQGTGIMSLFKKAKQTGHVDTQRFIDLEEVKNVGKKLEKLYNQFKNSNKSAESFMQEIIKHKRGSIIKNNAASLVMMGVVTPGIILAMRLLKKDNKEFQVKAEIKEKLQAQNFKGIV